MRFDFVTIFPNMFEPLLAEGIIARGVKQGLLEARVWDLRDFTADKHRSTDDEAYGGGPGMVMLAEPVLRAIEKLRFEVRGSNEEVRTEPTSSLEPRTSNLEPHIIMTTPQGRRFDHTVARELREKNWLVFLCGRYEGFDHRVHDLLQPDEISIGDFVVSGGELPAMVMADAVGRLVEGVVGNTGSVEEDSFYRGLLDYPHYTRPEEVRGLRVPDVLLSGHHEKIRKWRREQALRATLAKRPDLLNRALDRAELDDEAREILERIRRDPH
jgi:tRNA (guanine37-N1)-methyltransferase